MLYKRCLALLAIRELKKILAKLSVPVQARTRYSEPVYTV